MSNMLKVFLLIAIWGFIGALLTSSCRQDKAEPAAETIVPSCMTTVKRLETGVSISISGEIPGGGKIVAVFALDESEQRLMRIDFDVADVFKFEIGDKAPRTENIVPMVFMSGRDAKRQYVCKLSFDDKSPLTPEQLDGMARTKAAAESERR